MPWIRLPASLGCVVCHSHASDILRTLNQTLQCVISVWQEQTSSTIHPAFLSGLAGSGGCLKADRPAGPLKNTEYITNDENY